MKRHPRRLFWITLFLMLPLLSLACALSRGLAQTGLIDPPTPAPTVMLGPTFTPSAGVMNLPMTPPPTIIPLTDTQVLTPPLNIQPTAAPVPDPPIAGLIDVVFMETVQTNVLDESQRRFYPGNNFIPARYPVDRYQLHFRSHNELGRSVPIRAELYVPRVETQTQFPLFVYGAGTTGIGNTCAPLDEKLRNRNWGLYETHMLSYAAQGYIGLLPHWQGYDDQTRTHPYFIASLEGTILLDATRAAYEFFANPANLDILAEPAQAVFYGGYSEGGHGAFAAQDMAASYAPELPIKGVVGHATAPSVEALLRERSPLAPYIIYAYLNYYGGEIINPESVFQPQWLPTFYQDASTKCVDEVYEYYPNDPIRMYRPEFLEALLGDRLGEVLPGFKAALDENYVGNSEDINVPVILLHGEADDIVTPQTNEAFIAKLCNRGKNMTYKIYPGVNHFETRQNSFVDTLSWMQRVAEGNIPESGCSEFFNSQFE